MPAPVRPGDLVRGKYLIERELGEGGMGVVVVARHVGLNQLVALKFLLPAMLSHPLVVERFSRESRAASMLHSDHVARVLDVDRLEDGSPFIVMEYLEGSDLSFVRKQGRVLDPATAVGYVIEACDAIGEAHRAGIVHRDLKPANLFLARRPDGKTRVKVLDFGISKISNDSDPGVTKTNSVMGSAEYMSPEQMLSSRDVDNRSDIWALGVTLYELLTCRAPFPGETITQVYAYVMTRAPVMPTALRPDLPPGLDAVIVKCLALDREDRYSSIADLVNALSPFVSGVASKSSPTGTSPLAASPVTRPSEPAPARVSAPSPSGPAHVVGSSPAVGGEDQTLADEATASTVKAPIRARGGTEPSGGTHDGASSDRVTEAAKGSTTKWALLGGAVVVAAGLVVGVRGLVAPSAVAPLAASSPSAVPTPVPTIEKIDNAKSAQTPVVTPQPVASASAAPSAEASASATAAAAAPATLQKAPLPRAKSPIARSAAPAPTAPAGKLPATDTMH